MATVGWGGGVVVRVLKATGEGMALAVGCWVSVGAGGAVETTGLVGVAAAGAAQAVRQNKPINKADRCIVIKWGIVFFATNG